jgi:glycosyltransferase involved in cell wall biosynthesis
MPKLSVVIIARNEELNILRCLESVKPIADEIVVVDSISTDRTAGFCREFGCRVYQREFDGYGTQKQFAVDQASNDWILSVDADEVVSDELQHEINQLFHITPDPISDIPHPASDIPHPAFRIPFSLHFMGRLFRYSGVGNEFHLRLFDRTKGGFTRVPVHEGIEVNGSVGILHGRIIHYSYRDIGHHLEKINTYTSQAAEGYQKRGQSFSKIWVVLKFPTSFISFYFIKRGFLDGYPGFIWSFLAAVYATLKVAKTIELTRKP